MSAARSTIEAKLAQDPAIDALITLNASYAMTALPVPEASSTIGTSTVTRKIIVRPMPLTP